MSIILPEVTITGRPIEVAERVVTKDVPPYVGVVGNPGAFAGRTSMIRVGFVFDQLNEGLSHSGFLGTHARIPSLGWIPDFQHLHLKDVFSDNEIKTRNWHYKNVCRRCTGLILSSYNARKDLADFAPDCVDKSNVLQFVSGLNSKTESTGRRFL